MRRLNPNNVAEHAATASAVSPGRGCWPATVMFDSLLPVSRDASIPRPEMIPGKHKQIFHNPSLWPALIRAVDFIFFLVVEKRPLLSDAGALSSLSYALSPSTVCKKKNTPVLPFHFNNTLAFFWTY